MCLGALFLSCDDNVLGCLKSVSSGQEKPLGILSSAHSFLRRLGGEGPLVVNLVTVFLAISVLGINFCRFSTVLYFWGNHEYLNEDAYTASKCHINYPSVQQ